MVHGGHVGEFTGGQHGVQRSQVDRFTPPRLEGPAADAMDSGNAGQALPVHAVFRHQHVGVTR